MFKFLTISDKTCDKNYSDKNYSQPITGRSIPQKNNKDERNLRRIGGFEDLLVTKGENPAVGSPYK